MEIAGMYLTKVGPRIIARTLQTAVVGPRFKSSYVPPAYDYAESTVSLQSASAAQPLYTEGYQGGEHEFATQRARDIVDRDKGAMESSEVADPADTGRAAQADVNGEEELAGAYSQTGNVSLHMVMQSSVPDPYMNGGMPSHRNMPNGGDMQRQKYLSGQRQGTHPSRNYSTSPTLLAKAFPNEVNMLDRSPSLQGIQGDDCVHFKLWLENCQAYNFRDCEDQLKDLQSGRRTLQQIFEEQDKVIRKIAADYQKSLKEEKNETPDIPDSMQGLQGPVSFDSHNIEELSRMNQPCPQGVQGHECDNFKLWLKNCGQYGFGDCDSQLQGVQSGRKTLSEIFAEQDKMIQQVAALYRTSGKVMPGARHYSTSSSNQGDKDAHGQSAVKLSQKDKLKRAFKEYGATVVVFHVGMSLSMLGGFYLAVSSGLDVVGLLRSIGVGESVLESKLATGASTFVVAYASYKVFAPLRIAITLSVTPFLVRYMRRVGFLKPPKPSS